MPHSPRDTLTAETFSRTATFLYDGDGQRVQGTVNGVTTTYVGNHYEVAGTARRTSGQATTTRKYYFAGTQRIAVRENGVLSYLLADHLGSTSITVNASGTITGELRYSAWGETRFTYGTTPTNRRYTGQAAEPDLSIYYYGARWYDPALGRFISADSIVPSVGEGGNPNSVGYVANSTYSALTVDYNENQFLEQLNQENRKRLEGSKASFSSVPKNPIAFDRYAYTFNNPLNYTDPSGHILVPVLVGALIGGVISTGVYIAASSAMGNEITWSGGLGAFAGGAVAGAVCVIAPPLAGTLLHAANVAAAGTALTAGTAAVNAAGGAAAYLAAGYTQNAVDTAMGNPTTFQPTLVGVAGNAALAGLLSPVASAAAPVAANTMRTIPQAIHFMPGRTWGTLLATQNARNMFAQTGGSVFAGALGGLYFSQ